MAEDLLPNASIHDHPEYLGAPKDDDELLLWDSADGVTKKIKGKNIGQIAPSTNYEWVSTFEYDIDDIVNYGGKFYKSLQAVNEGHLPTDPAWWELQATAASSSLVVWTAGLFTATEVAVLYIIDGYYQLVRLKTATRPYASTDLALELAAGDWELMSERGYAVLTKASHGFTPGIAITYKTGNWNVYADGDTPLAIVRNAPSVNTFVVVFLGNVIKTLAGLTAGTMYYIQTDGTISAVASDKPVYFAFSATQAVLLAAGGGGTGSQDLTDVLTEGNDAGGLQIKNAADGTVAQDLVTLSQMTAAITAAVTGLLDYRGGFNAASGIWPTSAAGGSGSAGAILKADVWVVTTGGTLTGMTDAVEPGDWLVAKINAAGNTAADWDVINKNVVLATASVAGILKLYTTTGGNTDGTITQAAITAALNLKADSLWQITTKTGSYTMAAAEKTILDAGGALVMEGDSTGDLTIPLNSTTAFAVGATFAARAFANLIATGGVTITGTNGTLVIPTNRTVIVEKKATNTWLLHNGSATSAAWTTTTAGVVIESTQAQAEAVISGANTASTAGLSQTRTGSELGLYYAIRKFITLAWTWTLTQTFTAGTIHQNVTASLMAAYDGSKRLISIAYAALADFITGTDAVKPVTVAAILAYRRLKPTALTVVSNVLTVDCAGAVEAVFTVATPITANFSIVWANHTDAQYIEVWVQINGTVVAAMTNGTSGQPKIVSEDADLRYLPYNLTLITGSAKYHRFGFTRQTTGTTGTMSMEVSTPITV